MPAIFKADLICLMAPQYLDPGDDDDRMATTSDGGGVDPPYGMPMGRTCLDSYLRPVCISPTTVGGSLSRVHPIPATTLHWSMGVMCGKTRSPLWNECSQSDCAPLSCSPGRGLDAATVLADAGWVCVGSSSLRALPNSPSAPDAAVRILEDGDLRSARQLAEDVFRYRSRNLRLWCIRRRPPTDQVSVQVVGLFELDTLQTAAMLSFGKPISTVWAAGTRAQGQRRGHGLRVLRQVSAAAFEDCRRRRRVWSRQRCRQCSVRRERSRNRRVLADVVATAMATW